MSFRKTLLTVVLLEILLVVLALVNYGNSLAGLQAVTRYSGRLSLLLFSIVFIVLPDRQQLKKVLSDNPFLIFAVAHGIHLAELVAYVYLSGNELIPIRLAGGFIAYVLIFAMPVFQSRYEKGLITETHFKTALTVYQYYVWFIFFMSYLPRVQGKLPNVGGEYWEFVVLLAWVCMLMGMKLASLLLNGKRA
ncbi:MAG: hypothetical protein HRU69_00775 [Flammeovirgaceae bacterium]|nr:MAG: hypothetical protein HRU69_00775 [Flammeovirgaceae bacterium]